MKILCFTDNHFCQFSSIIRSMGKKYSLRLENQLESINWLERLAEAKNCDEIICAGDFFDATTLNSRELSALKEIKWSSIPHNFVVGNHEVDTRDLVFSSTKALNLPNFKIVDTVYHEFIENSKTVLTYIPYIVEDDRKPFTEYLYENADKQIVISHNDIKGISYGPIISKEGFELNEIISSGVFFVNGHIHNGQFLDKDHRVLNLGNLTGQNSCEDSFVYSHNVIIIDTETLEYEIIENPYAFNFYKVEIAKEADLAKLKTLKQNAVVVVRCESRQVDKLKELLATLPNIVEKRLLIYKDRTILEESTEETITLNSVDHILLFEKFAKQELAECDQDLLDQELAIIKSIGGAE